MENDPRGQDYFENNVLPEMENKPTNWLKEARLVAVDIAKTHGEVSADDVFDARPPPSNIEPRTMGAVFKTKDFEFVRYVQGRRSVRAIGIYKLKEVS